MSITLSQVSVTLGGRPVLHNMSCEFPSGILSVLVGPSGAGKTTLMNVIAGTLNNSTGEIRVSGRAPHPSAVTWVPQGANALPARSLLDNTMIAPLSGGLSRPRAIARSLRALNQVGLAGREHSLARELSGGELQRLAIARALASHKHILLADEPTANLDIATADEIIQVFAGLKLRQTLIVATHDAKLVAAADHIVDLRHEHAKQSGNDA